MTRTLAPGRGAGAAGLAVAWPTALGVTLTLTLALAIAASPALAEYRDPPKRDEFGVIPEDARDKDLVLPDPVLDRTWSGPKPGEGPRAVEQEPEQDDDRVPAPGEGTAPPPRKKAPEAREAGDGAALPAPMPPPIGPDGRRDPGSPAPELDPSLPDVLGRDAPDLSDLERDEARPSTFDRGGDPAAEPSGLDDAGGAGEE